MRKLIWSESTTTAYSPNNTQSYLNITISQSNSSIISSSSTVLPLGGGNIFHLRRDPGKGFHKYKSVPRIHSGRFSLLGGTIFSLNLRWGFLLDYTASSHIQITITIPSTKGLTMEYVWSFKFIKNSVMEGRGSSEKKKYDFVETPYSWAQFKLLCGCFKEVFGEQVIMY